MQTSDTIYTWLLFVAYLGALSHSYYNFPSTQKVYFLACPEVLPVLKKMIDYLMLNVLRELQTKYLSSYLVYVLVLVDVLRTSLLNKHLVQETAVVPWLYPKKAIRAKLSFIHEDLYLIYSSHQGNPNECLWKTGVCNSMQHKIHSRLRWDILCFQI